MTSPDGDVDELTSLPNRNAVAQYLDARPGVAATVVLLDIRGFMGLNDVFGQSAADAVLQAVAEALRSYAAPDELVARFGGDEFLALRPSDDIGEAMALAEQLRAAAQTVTAPTGRPLVVSVGVATGPLGRPLLWSADADCARDAARIPYPDYD